MAFSEVFLRNVLGVRQKVTVGIPVEGVPDNTFAIFDVVQFDASLSETHSITASITQHPVETGSDITDHYRGNPDTLSMDVVVSDTPIRFFSIANPASPVVDPERQTGKRSIDAYERLKAFIDEASVVDIFTTLRTYKNMALESYSVIRDAQTGNTLRASLKFREVITVDTETEQVKPSVSPENASRTPQQKTGTSPSPPATEATAVKSRSLLQILVDIFSGGGA